MSSNLQIKPAQSGDTLKVEFKGAIDASADYSSIEGVAASHFIFNMKGIDLVNSAGIQKWVKFMGCLPVEAKYTFEDVPACVVKQLNIFPGFTGEKKVDVVNFVAPFYCESCDDSKEVFLEKGKVLSGGQVAVPEVPCGKCKSAMEFDDIEDKYFLFLKRAA